MLRYNKSISSLDLSENKVESGGGQYILMSLDVNSRAAADAVQRFTGTQTCADPIAGAMHVQKKCDTIVNLFNKLVAEFNRDGRDVHAVETSADEIVKLGKEIAATAIATDEDAKAKARWASAKIASLLHAAHSRFDVEVATFAQTMLEKAKAADLNDASFFSVAIAEASVTFMRAIAILSIMDSYTIHLKTLDLTKNRIDLPTVIQLMRWGKQNKCEIEMSQTKAIEALFQGRRGKDGGTKLMLSDCYLAPAVNIGKWIELQPGYAVTWLDLSKNRLGNEATKSLSKWLSKSQSNSTLTDVNLSDNAIDTSHHIVDILKLEGNAIKRLDITGNHLKFARDVTVVEKGSYAGAHLKHNSVAASENTGAGALIAVWNASSRKKVDLKISTSENGSLYNPN